MIYSRTFGTLGRHGGIICYNAITEDGAIKVGLQLEESGDVRLASADEEGVEFLERVDLSNWFQTDKDYVCEPCSEIEFTLILSLARRVLTSLKPD